MKVFHAPILCCCICWISLNACRPGGKLTIGSGSDQVCQMMLEGSFREPELFEAGEVLQKYIAAISGEELSWAKIDEEGSGFYLSIDEELPNPHTVFWEVGSDRINIRAGSKEAMVSAVYTFLEEGLGYRFFHPEEISVPPKSALSLDRGISFSYTPPVKIRTVHSSLFYEQPSFAAAHKVSTEAFPYYAPSARVHTFHRLLPSEEFYEAHPEYYALRNGKRIPTQLCLTHPEVLNIVKERVRNLLPEAGEGGVISVSQDDNTQYCQCDQCEAIHQEEQAASGSLIHFVNAVAEAFPEINISTLAYQYSRKAPAKVKPRSNVLITLCSIECDRSKPIAQGCQEFTEDLQAWAALTDNIRIWDYTTQFTNFLAPFPNLRTLQPNLQLFVDNNAQWVFEQHSRQPSELFALRSYLLAKLLWNPSLSPEAVMQEFSAGYYQDAAPEIMRYVDWIHNEMEKDSSFFLFLYGDPSQAFGSYLRPDLLLAYDSLFATAAEKVKASPKLLSRVSEARLGVDYAILELGKTQAREAWADATWTIPKRLNRFERTTREAGITAMNEMRLTVAEYLAATRQTFQQAQQENLAHQAKVELRTKPKKYAGEDPQALTDGAFGGLSFYANWLGFEGNDAEVVVDLGQEISCSEVSLNFLQVTNHIVFFPLEVELWTGEKAGRKLGSLENQHPLSPASKINDIQSFDFSFPTQKIRFLRLRATNMKAAPVWHNAAGLPAWIFLDEIVVR
ncbi:MAG: DUF4838 domain-containing protein [Bacteroidota bacterium]